MIGNLELYISAILLRRGSLTYWVLTWKAFVMRWRPGATCLVLLNMVCLCLNLWRHSSLWG